MAIVINMTKLNLIVKTKIMCGKYITYYYLKRFESEFIKCMSVQRHPPKLG